MTLPAGLQEIPNQVQGDVLGFGLVAFRGRRVHGDSSGCVLFSRLDFHLRRAFASSVDLDVTLYEEHNRTNWTSKTRETNLSRVIAMVCVSSYMLYGYARHDIYITRAH